MTESTNGYVVRRGYLEHGKVYAIVEIPKGRTRAELEEILEDK